MPEPHADAELDQRGLLGRLARVALIPRRSAARHSRLTSPTGSAAASQQQALGLARKRPDPLHEGLLDAAGQRPRVGSPNPPASSAGVNPRGSSSSASGLPRVSATI
jgi:hypothetical protein